MSYAQNILVCMKGCRSRTRVGLDLLCNFSGRSVRQHARSDECGDPQDRFRKVMVASGRGIVEPPLNAAQPPPSAEPAKRCGCGGGVDLASAMRRVVALKVICEACPEMVRIELRERPLMASVLCKKVPGCCGGGPGTLDLVRGACIELKHEEALSRWKEECGGELC